MVALFAIVAPVATALDPSYQEKLSHRREDIIETLSLICMRAGQLRASGHLKGPSQFVGGAGSIASRPLRIGAASPLALPASRGMHGLHASTPMDSTVTPPSGAMVSPLLAGGFGGFGTLSGAGGALVAQGAPETGGAGSGAGRRSSQDARMPWMLVMHCLNYTCVALWGSGSDAEVLHLWPPGGYTAGGGMRGSRCDLV